jgi:hypothetical protein
MCKRPISYEAADELDQLITKCDEKEKQTNKTRQTVAIEGGMMWGINKFVVE